MQVQFQWGGCGLYEVDQSYIYYYNYGRLPVLREGDWTREPVLSKHISPSTPPLPSPSSLRCCICVSSMHPVAQSQGCILHELQFV